MKARITYILLFIFFMNILHGQNLNETKYRFAQEVFKNKYKKKSYKRFDGKISEINDQTIVFDDKTLQIFNLDSRLKILFLKGIFYPNIFAGNETTIVKSKEEVSLMSVNEKVFYNKLHHCGIVQ